MRLIFASVILFCIVDPFPALLQPPPESDHRQETKPALVNTSVTSVSKFPR